MSTVGKRIPYVLIPLAIVLLSAGLTGCGSKEEAGKQYHCPMHPTYISDRPGDCPICGMRLVPIETKTAPTVTMRGPDGTLYTLVGAWSITSRFNGVYYSGKYTYDMTFTAPNGAVWGTYKGTNSLDIYGRPYGALQGTCANPL